RLPGTGAGRGHSRQRPPLSPDGRGRPRRDRGARRAGRAARGHRPALGNPPALLPDLGPTQLHASARAGTGRLPARGDGSRSLGKRKPGLAGGGHLRMSRGETTSTLEAAVPPAAIWEKAYTDAAAWPRWNAEIKRATLDGPLTLDARAKIVFDTGLRL